jgi:hypothetical protein
LIESILIEATTHFTAQIRPLDKDRRVFLETESTEDFPPAISETTKEASSKTDERRKEIQS